MKRPAYSILLRILATTAVGSFICAAAVTARASLFKTDGGLLLVGFFILTMVFGHMVGGLFLRKVPLFAIRASARKPVKFISFMLNLKDTAYSASAFAAWVLILLPVLAAFLVFMKFGFLRMIFEIFIIAIAYASALRYSQQSFIQILSDKKAYAGFIILALCLEIPYFFSGVSYLKPWLLGISYFFILSYLLIKNQEDIDSNIFDKKHIEKSILPKNLRKFNTFWVCMLFLAVVLLFNAKPLVLLLLQLVGRISIYILAALMWLLEQILPFQSAQQQGGGPSSAGFFGNTPEMIMPFRNLISNVIRNAVILYLLYRLALVLAKWIPILVRKGYELIRKLFSFRKGEKVYETSDYSDETEMIKPVREQEQKRHLKKKMRKSGRTLKSISDPVERVRYMYASILTMLPLLGVRAEQSDTTADILKKIDTVPLVSSELCPFTQIYNHVRYGEKVPDGGMLTAAEGHFGKAVEVIGQK